jgi:hypothetical protein
MALGFRNYWDGYFAGRAAPLGRVPAEVAHAAFYNFAEGEAARHVPGVWDNATPRRRRSRTRQRRRLVTAPVLCATIRKWTYEGRESLQETLFWQSVPGIHEDIAEARRERAEGRGYDEADVRSALGLPRRA